MTKISNEEKRTMADERWTRDVFEQLEPPLGGVVHLRARLDDERHRRRRKTISWAFAMTSVAAAAVALWMVLQPGRGPAAARARAADVLVDASGVEHPALVRYGLAAAPVEPVTIAPAARAALAARRVGTDGDDVVFYWVSRVDVDVEVEVDGDGPPPQ